MTLTAEELLQHMRDHLGVDTAEIDAASPLFSSGMIDSFSLVSLICFIESRCGEPIDPTDITLDNMDSINRILAFINRRSGGADLPAETTKVNGYE